MRDKIGKKYFIVRESIFHRRVHVFINFTGKEFTAFCKKKGFEELGGSNSDDNFAAFSATKSESGKADEWIIVIKRFNWCINDQGSLVHEVVHTIMKIWDANNIPHSLDNQEFLAHAIANLWEDIAAKILGLKKIKNA